MAFMRIVTHAGQAHRDEVLACAVALAYFPSIVIIDRRDPTAEELEDKDVLVLDVGGEHNPEKGNFDHHQLARDAAPACAFSLLVEWLGLSAKFALLSYFESTKIMDSKGPMALAKHLGLANPSAIFANMSPIEGAIVSMFEKAESWYLYGEHPMFEMLRELGHQLSGYAEERWGQQQWLQAHARVVAVGGVEVLIIENTNTEGVQQFRDAVHPGAAVSVSWDDRGAGWALYRFNDHSHVDFSRVASDPRVGFAHNAGFIAKTRERISEVEVLALVQGALK